MIMYTAVPHVYPIEQHALPVSARHQNPPGPTFRFYVPEAPLKKASPSPDGAPSGLASGGGAIFGGDGAPDSGVGVPGAMVSTGHLQY